LLRTKFYFPADTLLFKKYLQADAATSYLTGFGCRYGDGVMLYGLQKWLLSVLGNGKKMHL
jgi:hypothetical protein